MGEHPSGTVTAPKSRNDPCPCGSGKRYKHCHGQEVLAIAALPASQSNTVLALMHRALAAQRATHYAEAAALYDQALALDPKQADALHMRGVVALSQGDHRRATQWIQAAINEGLNTVDTRYNLSLALDAARMALGAMVVESAGLTERSPTDRFIAPNDVQLLAYYLPQFHAIPENDQWWGSGFTEWINVRRSTPNFPGHEQPRVPAQLGYYNLLDAEVRAQQARLASAHGVTGFCYHHYGFKGKRLLEAPLNEVLRSRQPDFPFCVFWANENWTKRWDGGGNELLMAQSHDADDDRRFIEHLLPFFDDPRYIRVHGRPLLMIYRIEQFANARHTINRWAEVCAAHGIAKPYVVKADTRMSDAPHVYGADASVEFPPHRLALGWRARAAVEESLCAAFRDTRR
jgi:tetratricopeptide (TPR) repeat protein